MKRCCLFLLVLFLGFSGVQAAGEKKVKPVKNVILLIPDGTSLQTVSLARWCQWYLHPDKPNLNIDPYICGTVRSFCSNAPIGDSAPTTSCYMTGYPSLAGFVSTHPYSEGENDIFPVDNNKAYQPLTTVLEASRMLKNKATGLVFVCEFPHATPADCASHTYKRSRFGDIASQMVHNDIDVVIGGGTSYLNAEGESYLKSNGYGVFKDDIDSFRNYDGNKMWALFAPGEMPYDLDRDTLTQPSLEEMTRKAIEKLSKNKDGFFLMVEGSLVDHAAHGNDAVGIYSDFLAFDKACGAAFEFARKNGETAVIVVPDHGTGGPVIRGSYQNPKKTMFGNLVKIKRTASGLAKLLNSRPADELASIFKEYAGITLTDEEIEAFYNCDGYKSSPVPKEKRVKKKDNALYNYGSSLSKMVGHIYDDRVQSVRFTTGGHTGEELILAVYHPKGTVLTGMKDNFEINRYLCDLLGLRGKLDQLTETNFAKHQEVFQGYRYDIVPAKDKNANPVLQVSGNGKTLEIEPFTNLVKVGDKEIRLNSVVVYMDKNETFYLPKRLADYLK